MSRERALLRRLVEWDLKALGSVVLSQILKDVHALLAEPEGEGQTCPVCEVPTIPIGARCPQCNETFWTPEELRPIWVSRRSRAEAEAMVRKHKYACMSIGYYAEDVLGEGVYAYWLNEERIARAAILAALTGEGT